MGKITDFLRKIGVLHVSSGDYNSGEFDNREDLKKESEGKINQEDDQQGESRDDHDHKGSSCCSH